MKKFVFILTFIGFLAIISKKHYAQEWSVIPVDSLLSVEKLYVCAGPSNVGHIVYQDNENHDLKMAKYNGSYFDFSTIDEEVWGGDNVLAFKPDGNPAVLYYEGATSSNLSYGCYDGSTWTIQETGIEAGSAIAGASMVFDASGNAHISFHKYSTEWELHYGYYDGTSWTSEMVVTGGVSSSIAIADDETLHIAFTTNGGKLKYAQKAVGGSWTTEDVSDANNSNQPQVVLKSDGNPCISFTHEETVKFAVWDGSAWEFTDIGGITAGSDEYVTMDMDNNDGAHFTLYGTYTLKYVYFDGTDIETTDLEMIASTDQYPNIDVGTDGSIHIVHGNVYRFLEGSGSGIQNQSGQVQFQKLRAYPNPCKDMLNVCSENPFQLLDITGRILYTSQEKPGRNQIINTTEFEKGMYILRTLKENSSAIKILIE